MKKHRSKIIKNFILILVFLNLVGCTDSFKEWNINQHEATDEMLMVDNLYTGSFFTQMQRNVFIVGDNKGAEYQVTENLAADLFSGFMGNVGVYSYATFHNSHYALYKGWYDVAFNQAYKNIMQPWYSIKAKVEKELPATYALATIVKVFGMLRITDMYGPIPYSKFGRTLKAKYDAQKDVYTAFFSELDFSIKTLTEVYNGNSSAKILTDYDYIYGGSVAKWIKFANTLRLRLAIRLSYVDASKARLEAEEAIAHSLGVMESTDDSAILHQGANLRFKHPLWEISESFNDTRMGATMDAYLNGYKDPRVSAYFQKTSSGEYIGVRGGIYIFNKSEYAEGPFSRLNYKLDDNVLWMDVAESYFLRAEGVLRGWNMGGKTVKQFYEEGIEKSFESKGVSGYETYISNETNLPKDYVDPANLGNNASVPSTVTVKWKEDDFFEKKLERIITQKWIALYPDGQEAWTEFRRTGYPKVIPIAINQSNGEISTERQIRRLKFPSTEYDNNAVNVNEAVGFLGGLDTGGTRLWWDAK